MKAYSDLTIPSERYATQIEDYITAKSVDLLYSFYEDVASQFEYETPSYEDIENVGYNTGALPEMRDAVIAYLAECGFCVEPDDSNF